VTEAANAHAEATAAREASPQTKIEAAQKIQCVKEAMSGQAKKEVASVENKLEVAERKAKDTASDLQAVVEGKFFRSPKIDSTCPLGLFLIFRP
jgi:multidrug resistance efflux pump